MSTTDIMGSVDSFSIGPRRFGSGDQENRKGPSSVLLLTLVNKTNDAITSVKHHVDEDCSNNPRRHTERL